MNWPITRLRYVADLNPAMRDDLRYRPDAEVSFLPMEAIGENGSINLERLRPVSEVRNGYSYFEDGDVAFAKVTPCFENGKGALMRGLALGAGFGTSELTVLRPKPTTDARFLDYVIRSEPFRQHGAGAMTGAGGLKRVPDEFTRDFKTPWPGTVEQQRIANFLDEQTARIDALIAEKEALIERLAESEASQILALVTGARQENLESLNPHAPNPAHLPQGWKLPALARLVSKLTNGFVGPTRDILVTEGVRYLQSLHIKAGTIDFGRGEYFVAPEWSLQHEKSILAKNDILIVQTGDIGQTALVADEFVGCNCHALIIARPRTELVLPAFLELVLRSAYGRAAFDIYSTGALHPHLNCSNIRDIRIPCPPIQEQEQTVAKASVIQENHRALSSHTLRHIDRLQEYRSSLISAAVTGQLNIDDFGARQLEAA